MTPDLTVAARLRRLYAEADAPGIALSTAQLAELIGADERTIERAHRDLRRTYGPRFVEDFSECVGRILLPPRRRILTPPPPGASPDLSDHGDLASTDLRAIAPRVRATGRRPASSAPRETRRSTKRPPRRRAVRLEIPRPVLDPLSLDVAVLAALEARHGRRGLREVLRVLEERPCRERPAEARLAALTVAERYARSPGALFRHLFARACDGDTLLERDAEAAKTRAAELSELLEPDATPERLREVRDELRARLAAVRIGGDLERVEELERALRELDDRIGPAPRPPTPVPRAASPPPPTGPPVPLDELADLAAQIAARLRTEAER